MGETVKPRQKHQTKTKTQYVLKERIISNTLIALIKKKKEKKLLVFNCIHPQLSLTASAVVEDTLYMRRIKTLFLY
jgi:hypothetical protein